MTTIQCIGRKMAVDEGLSSIGTVGSSLNRDISRIFTRVAPSHVKRDGTREPTVIRVPAAWALFFFPLGHFIGKCKGLGVKLEKLFHYIDGEIEITDRLQPVTATAAAVNAKKERRHEIWKWFISFGIVTLSLKLNKMIPTASRLRRIWRLALCAAFVSCASPTWAEEIPLDKFMLQFAPDALGGIRIILRYVLAAPDRDDTAIIFLEGPNKPGDLPDQIQILDTTGAEQRALVESEGADCVLEHVSLFREGGEIAVITATRVFDTTYGSQSASGPMDLRLFQLKHDRSTGRPSAAFVPTGITFRTMPICNLYDLKGPMEEIIGRWKIESHK